MDLSILFLGIYPLHTHREKDKIYKSVRCDTVRSQKYKTSNVCGNRKTYDDLYIHAVDGSPKNEWQQCMYTNMEGNQS